MQEVKRVVGAALVSLAIACSGGKNRTSSAPGLAASSCPCPCPDQVAVTRGQCEMLVAKCASSWSAYRDNFPAEGLAALKDPKQRAKGVEDSFRSTIERCKDAI